MIGGNRERVASGAGEKLRKGLKSLIILGAWTLWNHRNNCVFDGASPNLARAFYSLGKRYSPGVWLGLEVSLISAVVPE